MLWTSTTDLSHRLTILVSIIVMIWMQLDWGEGGGLQHRSLPTSNDIWHYHHALYHEPTGNKIPLVVTLVSSATSRPDRVNLIIFRWVSN